MTSQAVDRELAAQGKLDVNAELIGGTEALKALPFIERVRYKARKAWGSMDSAMKPEPTSADLGAIRALSKSGARKQRFGPAGAAFLNRVAQDEKNLKAA